jgi:hypothetical protein
MSNITISELLVETDSFLTDLSDAELQVSGGGHKGCGGGKGSGKGSRKGSRKGSGKGSRKGSRKGGYGCSPCH